MKKRHEQKLVILSIGLIIVFNFPLIMLVDSSDAVYGIPVLYLYIFGFWLVAVIISYMVLKRHYE